MATEDDDSSEYVAPSVLELAKVVKDPMSRSRNLVGDDGDYWALSVEGSNTLAQRFLVFLRFPKNAKGPLQIVDFQIIP